MSVDFFLPSISPRTDVSHSIEQDTKIRDQLRLTADSQAEIDMLEKQAAQEFDGLKDKIRENSGFLAANGEVVRVTEDDPVCPLQVVKDNIRQKYENAEREIDRCHKTVSDLQSKVTEKNALLTNHKGRLAQLRLKATQLDHEDGPVQKISRVVNALVREQRDLVEEDEIKPESPPTEVIKFISQQINELGSVLKDDQISKVVKRIKKMVRECDFLIVIYYFTCSRSLFRELFHIISGERCLPMLH